MWFTSTISNVVHKKGVIPLALASSPTTIRMTSLSTGFVSRCFYSISWKPINAQLPSRHIPSYSPHLSYACNQLTDGFTSHGKNDVLLLCCCNYFSSNAKTTTKSNILLNDSLRFILTNRGRLSSDTVQVRVVVASDLLSTEEKSPSAPTGPTTSILSNLTHAFDIAQRHQMDLIGVHLSQTPPVVKVIDKATLNTGQVESNKNASPQKTRQQSFDKNNSKKSNAPAVTVKEVKFKVGIAENDLVRKLQQAKSYLQKGYICQVSIFCPRRFYKAEEEEEEKEGEEVASSNFGSGFDPNNYNIDQRIYEHVQEYLLHEPKVKRNKNLTSIVLHPKPANPNVKC